MHQTKLLVCDLDNTLYDWVGYFVPSFYAMVDSVVSITGCDREQLLDDFRVVHQKYSDSEQPFALLETNTVRCIFEGIPIKAVLEKLDPAFHAFNSTRKKLLKLHPGVRETLDGLTKSGIHLVAHTESRLHGVVDRLQRLDLHRYFLKIYCRERSLSTTPINLGKTAWLDEFPMYKVVELSHHQGKPNASVLLEICKNQDISRENTAYVGDSIARDILMAKRAGVFSVWAAYGADHDPTLYKDLVRISHWTAKEVDQEKKLRDEAKSITPDFTARNSFSEVLTALTIDRAESLS